MPEILNIPVLESPNARYKPTKIARVASIVVCLLLAALLSVFTVRYFFAVTNVPLSTQLQQGAERRVSRIPSISERMDALHSTVAQLQSKVTELQAKNSNSFQNHQPADILQQMWPNKQTHLAPRGQKVRSSFAPFTKAVPQLKSFEKEKRMVSWQPVKRGSLLWTAGEMNDERIVAAFYDLIARERAMSTIEQQLAVVLHAGERLGISAESILENLRTQNIEKDEYLKK